MMIENRGRLMYFWIHLLVSPCCETCASFFYRLVFILKESKLALLNDQSHLGFQWVPKTPPPKPSGMGVFLVSVGPCWVLLGWTWALCSLRERGTGFCDLCEILLLPQPQLCTRGQRQRASSEPPLLHAVHAIATHETPEALVSISRTQIQIPLSHES